MTGVGLSVIFPRPRILERSVSNQDEPGYLKALRKSQEKKKHSSAGADPGAREPSWSATEREALRWAREVANQDVRANPSLKGARFAIVSQPKTWDGKAPIMLDGFPTQEALLARYEAATSFGDKVLGCYEVSSARPLTVSAEGGKTSFTPGTARPVSKPMTPEQMIRKAAQAAEQQAKLMGKGKTEGRRR